MSTTTPVRRPMRRALGAVSALATAAVGLSVVATSPANASDAVGTLAGAAATTGDLAFAGNAIHIDGTGWTKVEATSGAGSCIAVKLGSGSGASGPGAALSTTQLSPATATGSCVGVTPPDGVWALVPAASDGTVSADIPFPTAANSTGPAVVDADWAAGTTHHLRLLTGIDGSVPRTAYLDFTVAAPATTPTILPATAAFSAAGASAALTGSGFAGNTVLSATLGATALNFSWRSGQTTTTNANYTVPLAGTISGVNVVLPADTRAGSYTVTVHGDDGSAEGFDLSVPVTVTPALAWSAGSRQNSSGTLTVTGLPADAVISQVTVGGTTVTSTAFAAASSAGTASGSYTIPASIPTGAAAIVLTQTAPSAATYTVNGTVYPDETPSGTNRFTVISDANNLPASPAGLYQSAYSTTSDALFVTAANQGQGTSGFLYKLDPTTLELEDSVDMPAITEDADGNPVSGIGGGFGIGVDDVHGTVWVTLTGRNYGTVAVYRQSDLALLKQLPTSTISHPRDVVYDPKTNLVFASSASEGATGNGNISVFESADNNNNGTPYEKVKDIQTGPRSAFNPVSLSLDNGTLVSPSLSSDSVAVIDTAASATSPEVAAGQVDAAVHFLDVAEHSTAGNGRGASGIALDKADNRLFVASQNDNAVFVADATTGALLKTVQTGQQTLNVAFDKVHKLVYVTNFGGTSVTVLDINGNKVAALPIARANHVTVDGKGNAFVVDKNTTPTNKVWKVSPHLETVNGTDIVIPTTSGATGDPATTPLQITVNEGDTLHVAGTNFFVADGSSGSAVAVKLDGGAAEPASGKVTNPNTGLAVNGVYGLAQASASGAWSLDLPFPSAANVSNAALAWAPGTVHNLRLLTGSLKSGDTIRSIAIKVTVNPNPPVDNPPADNPPADNPPANNPPANNPPVTTPKPTLPLIKGLTLAKVNKVKASTSKPKVGKKITLKNVPKGITKVVKTKKGKKTVTHKYKVTITYKWYVSGKAIKGATKSSYTPPKKYKGKTITVKVTWKQKTSPTYSKTYKVGKVK